MTKAVKATKAKGALKAGNAAAKLVGSALSKHLLDQKLNTDLAKIRKNLGISGSSFDPDEPRLHTGLLALDILIGGGIVSGGWYTVFGGEQSAKTTIAMTIMAALIKQKFEGRASYWDYEGSGSPDYIANILKSQKVNKKLNEVFGDTHPETGEVILEPLVEYVSTQAGEKFFEYFNRLARALPEKVKIGKEYYYLFDNNKENTKLLKGHYDQKYLTKNNKLKIPAEDGTMQALALLDSYPAMLPARADKEDGDASLGLQARMFSDQIKRIKPYFKQKRITVFGINQIRQRPATMFGNPEYEPCGETLKFFSDVRIKSTSRALPSGWPAKKGAGAVTEENSVEYDGTDEYRFIHLRIIKNKLGGFQNGEAWARIWIRDGNGDARGIDPVYDTWFFLKELNWLSGTKNNMKFPENVPLHGAKKLDWMTFKVLVLGKKDEVKAACKKVGIKAVDIRLWCKKQVLNGKALRAKAVAISGGKTAEEGSDED